MKGHKAIYLSNDDNKKQLIEELLAGKVFPFLKGLKGYVFSDLTLDKIIDEELLHDKYNYVSETDRSIQFYSEGEKRKALLNHFLNQNPDYLILDNLFDHLDANSRKQLEKQIGELSETTIVIQLANRNPDILGFISDIYVRKSDGTLEKVEKTLQSKSSLFHIDSIPEAHAEFKDYDTIFEFSDVSVRYGDKAVLNNINWTVLPGEFWQLTGPNGSGKSTLLSMIYGNNTKAYGQDVKLFGQPKGSGETIWDIKEKIGYYSTSITTGFRRQETVEKMILSGFMDSIGLYKPPTFSQIQIMKSWLKLLHLDQQGKEKFHNLSLGRQRMVMVARAMVKHPPLLILDEPTSGLDDSSVEVFVELINTVASKTKTTILFVSHRPEPGLKPQKIFELVPTANGSEGVIKI